MHDLQLVAITRDSSPNSRPFHLPDSHRPFECPEDGRSKRFWTAQHLKVHESMDKGEKLWKVVSDLNLLLGCPLNDLSSIQERAVCVFLRNTTTLEHTSTIISPGRSYICASIRTVRSRSTRIGSHGLTRNPTTRSRTLSRIRLAFLCPPFRFSPPGRNFKLRPYLGRNGKYFSQQKGLEAHLKIPEGEGARRAVGCWGRCNQ